ncbi:MAG: AAA family ATPase, partial [Nitrospiraceae bacterium]|nr:AAA family ATPase [Nitrospiraceae bacterium]
GEEINRWQAFVRDVPAAPEVVDYAVRLVLATHPAHETAPGLVPKYVRFGSSPRGAQALLLAGKVNALRASRFNVSFADVREAALAALRHRVLLNFEAEADGVSSDDVVNEVLGHVSTVARVA